MMPRNAVSRPRSGSFADGILLAFAVELRTMFRTRYFPDNLHEMRDTPSAQETPVAPATLEQSAWHARASRWVFVLVAAALLPLMVLASFDFGVTWDEKSRHFYGELVWGYLRGVRDISFFPETGGHLYGGLFDTLCAIVEQWLPQNRYVVRHEINAIFGWIGVVYCGRLAARLFGTWTGVLAMILLVSSPRYFAHSMNNPKDLPFAALSVVALYYFSTVSPTWPYISRATAIKIVVALALALNVRAGALLYLGYLGLLVMAFVVAERNWNWRRLMDTVARLTAITVAVLVLGTAFWPWAQGSPLTRPIRALIGMAGFPWAGGVLFNGQAYSAPDLPRYYVPEWFLISTPLVVLAGAALSMFVRRGDGARLPRIALWVVALLPVSMVIARDSTLYDGVRHLLFVYPILVVLAASGWAAWMSSGRVWVRRTAAALLVAGMVNPLAFHARSHPNQAVYFNELVGGPRGAFAKFDMDYWGNCLLEAVAWSARTAQLSGRPIAISGNPWQLIQLDSERFPSLYFTPPQRRQDHLSVYLSRGSAEGVIGLATRQDALYRVKTADGTVLCVVVPGPAFGELQPHVVFPPSEWLPQQLTRK